MRNILLTLSALVLAGFCFGQTPQDNPYPITVHVTSRETVFIAMHGNVAPYAEITATIEGHHYKLIGTSMANTKFSFGVQPTTMRTGDYKARVLQDKQVDAASYFREYELLLSDRKTLKFMVIGESE